MKEQVFSAKEEAQIVLRKAKDSEGSRESWRPSRSLVAMKTEKVLGSLGGPKGSWELQRPRWFFTAVEAHMVSINHGGPEDCREPRRPRRFLGAVGIQKVRNGGGLERSLEPWRP